MPMNKIALIALDLDGTLMQHDTTITVENKKAVLECLRQGIYVYAVTGRPYSFARMIADSIHKDVRVVAANGGIYEQNGHCIEQPIDPYALTHLIDLAQRYQVSLFLKGKRDYFSNVPYDPRFLYDNMNERFRKDLQVRSFANLPAKQLKQQAHDILKILAYHEDPEIMNAYRQALESAELVTITDYRPISFDITAKHVDKGTVLSKICTDLQLEKQQIMACGDANNDQAMFQASGWRVAMSNASPSVQQQCDAVADNSDGCGVARAIHQFVLN